MPFQESIFRIEVYLSNIKFYLYDTFDYLLFLFSQYIVRKYRGELRTEWYGEVGCRDLPDGRELMMS